MSRTYYRKVSTSAAPSRANWDTDQPRECHYCQGKLRITRDSIIMRRFPKPRSWHAHCHLLWLQEHQ